MAAAAILVLAAGVMSMAAPAHESAGKFVVHEWGTFSSFSGSDGTPLKFYPSNTDLPAFVHRGKSLAKDAYLSTVSLETPVVYFYSDRPLTAKVRAEFKGGRFTEWFPRVEGKETFTLSNTLTWSGIRVRPGDASPLPLSPGDNHYYAAREVDAAPIEIVTKHNDKESVEREKFLFYRGVGDPKIPLTVNALGRDSFTLRATGDAPIPAAVVVEVKGGRMRSRPIDPLSPGAPASVTLGSDWTDAAPVRATLVRMLTAAGLYEKESRAMVKTWESAWLKDEGTRVLYVLPGSWTDRTLPLTVTPKPDSLVRVMVGRHDVLTPEREKEIDGVVRRTPDRETATAQLGTLGRFAGPAREQAERRVKQK
jgi:hypothetical protein